jgi:hypothetical protein
MATAAFGQRAQIPYPNPINHVIIIDQENRTIDNLFGSNAPANQYYLPGLVFATSGKAWTLVNGKKTVITVQSVSLPLPSTVGSNGSVLADDYDPNHSHSLWVTACDAPLKTGSSNTCAMDGFNPSASLAILGRRAVRDRNIRRTPTCSTQMWRHTSRSRRSMATPTICSKPTRGRVIHRIYLRLVERRSRGWGRSRTGLLPKTI